MIKWNFQFCSNSVTGIQFYPDGHIVRPAAADKVSSHQISISFNCSCWLGDPVREPVCQNARLRDSLDSVLGRDTRTNDAGENRAWLEISSPNQSKFVISECFRHFEMFLNYIFPYLLHSFGKIFFTFYEILIKCSFRHSTWNIFTQI